MPAPLPAEAAPPSSVQRLIDLAAELGQPGVDKPAAAGQLIESAAGDRQALEQARNSYARRLHGHSDDWTATAALSLLNRALTDSGWIDPFDWKGRRKP